MAMAMVKRRMTYAQHTVRELVGKKAELNGWVSCEVRVPYGWGLMGGK